MRVILDETEMVDMPFSRLYDYQSYLSCIAIIPRREKEGHFSCLPFSFED